MSRLIAHFCLLCLPFLTRAEVGVVDDDRISGVYSASSRYPFVVLNEYCDRGFIDLSIEKRRAGSLVFKSPFTGKCQFTLSSSADAYGSSSVAIYFNVRELHLRLNESVRIYHNSTNSIAYNDFYKGSSLAMSMSYASFAHLDPRSFGQVRSSFGTAPQLNFLLDFQHRGDQQQSGTGFVLDWTVIRQDKGESETFCPALGGFVPDKLLCDQNDPDRVFCPANYVNYLSNVNQVEDRVHLNPSDPRCRKPDYWPQHLTSHTNLSLPQVALLVGFCAALIMSVCATIAHFTDQSKRQKRFRNNILDQKQTGAYLQHASISSATLEVRDDTFYDVNLTRVEGAPPAYTV